MRPCRPVFRRDLGLSTKESTVSISALEKHRKQYQPKLPPSLRQGIAKVKLVEGKAAEPVKDKDAIRKAFPLTYGMPLVSFQPGEGGAASGSGTEGGKPLKVGVVLSGGQAPGGHNVIAGIFDGIRAIHPKSEVYGFLGGPGGLEKGKYEVISDAKMDAFRNTGGFDIIGSGRTKLETSEQFDRCIEVVGRLGLDAVVIIGGDDSNTNAAILAEYMKGKGLSISVIGVPKTIDGDLKNEHIPVSFGFDTAVKTYSELIGNIARDASSAKKYWHFIKLMGRSASHIALEAGLQTQANVVLVSEEVEKKHLSPDQIVEDIVRVVKARAEAGKNYGLVLIPEGLIEFIPSVKNLIARLNDELAHKAEEFSKLGTAGSQNRGRDRMAGRRSREDARRPPQIHFRFLAQGHPAAIAAGPRSPRQRAGLPHRYRRPAGRAGGPEAQVRRVLSRASSPPSGISSATKGAPPRRPISTPTIATAWARVAALLVRSGRTGYMASIRNVSKGVDQWTAGGIPITMLFNMEQRHGKQKPVIQKALVDLEGPAFKALQAGRAKWEVEDAFIYPGPIQYFGPSEVCDAITKTLVPGAGLSLHQE